MSCDVSSKDDQLGHLQMTARFSLKHVPPQILKLALVFINPWKAFVGGARQYLDDLLAGKLSREARPVQMTSPAGGSQPLAVSSAPTPAPPESNMAVMAIMSKPVTPFKPPVIKPPVIKPPVFSTNPVKPPRFRTPDVPFKAYGLGFPPGCKMLQPNAMMCMTPVAAMREQVKALGQLEPAQSVSRLKSITIQSGDATVLVKNPTPHLPSWLDWLGNLADPLNAPYHDYLPCNSKKVAGSISLTFWGNDQDSISEPLRCILSGKAPLDVNAPYLTLEIPFDATLLNIDVLSTTLDLSNPAWGGVKLRPMAICGFKVCYSTPSGQRFTLTKTFDSEASITGSFDLESFAYDAVPGKLTDNVVVGFLPWATEADKPMFVGIQFVVARLPSQVTYAHLSDPSKSAAASPLLIQDSDVNDNHDVAASKVPITNDLVGSSTFDAEIVYSTELITTFAVEDTNNTAIKSSLTNDTNLSVVVFSGDKLSEAMFHGSYRHSHSKAITISRETAVTLNSSTATRRRYSQSIGVTLAPGQSVNVFTYKYMVIPSTLSFPVVGTYIWGAFDGSAVSVTAETTLALRRMRYDVITAHVVYDVNGSGMYSPPNIAALSRRV